MKTRYLGLLFLASLFLLTLALRGAVPDKTYLQSEVLSSSVQAAVVTYPIWSETGWSVKDFEEDRDNWQRWEHNVNSSLRAEKGVLCLETVFHDQNQDPQWVSISRSLNVSLSETPIFMINVSVSKGAIYHIRFIGRDSQGTRKPVWWETSPLDDIPGSSQWTTHVLNLNVFIEGVRGSLVSRLELVEVILDNPHSPQSGGEKFLRISSIGFGNSSLNVHRISGSVTYSASTPFQAIILELPPRYGENETWNIKWASATYTLTSSQEMGYEMLLLSRDDASLPEALGPVFLTHASPFIDIYRMDAPSQHETLRREELTLLRPLLTDLSVLILVRGFPSGGFHSFHLQSIQVVCTKEGVYSSYAQDTVKVNQASMVLAVLVLILPSLLLVSVSRLGRYFISRQRLLFLILAAYGVSVRLVLAPFTGHPYDMDVWTEAMRLFYESGVMDFRTIPLPLTYYLQLLAYAPYALLQVLGLHDTYFLAHGFRMVEAVFLKAPFILADLLSLYFLLKILGKLSHNTSFVATNMVQAFIYFLSPLAILLSGVWGMYDGIAVAFFLAGIYYGLLEERRFRATLVFTLSGLTKAFGFLGLIPLTASSLREKKPLQLISMVCIAASLILLLYAPLLIAHGPQSIPELFIQFLRGRAGLGSNILSVSSSYLSYLSLCGLNVHPVYLTILLAIIVAFITVYAIYKMVCSHEGWRTGPTIQYFIIVFLVVYLCFFRVYEQYYLWVIPLLLIHSHLGGGAGSRIVAASLGSLVLMTSPLLFMGVLYAGVECFLIPLQLPADAAIMAVPLSTLIVLSLVNTLNLGKLSSIVRRGGITTALAATSLWSTLSLAYYMYYGRPFLRLAWYPLTLIITSMSGLLLYKELQPQRWMRLTKGFTSRANQAVNRAC